MKKILFLILVITLLAVTVQADECVDSGVMEKMLVRQSDTVAYLDNGEAYSVLNPYNCSPGDYVKVVKNNQGSYYIVKMARITGKIARTELVLTDGRRITIKGSEPEDTVTLVPDCDGKYQIEEAAE